MKDLMGQLLRKRREARLAQIEAEADSSSSEEDSDDDVLEIRKALEAKKRKKRKHAAAVAAKRARSEHGTGAGADAASPQPAAAAGAASTPAEVDKAKLQAAVDAGEIVELSSDSDDDLVTSRGRGRHAGQVATYDPKLHELKMKQQEAQHRLRVARMKRRQRQMAEERSKAAIEAVAVQEASRVTSELSRVQSNEEVVSELRQDAIARGALKVKSPEVEFTLVYDGKTQTIQVPADSNTDALYLAAHKTLGLAKSTFNILNADDEHVGLGLSFDDAEVEPEDQLRIKLP